MCKKQISTIGTIGINGFGRIGRLFLRQCLLQSLPVVAINDLSLNPRYAAYMLKFDSSQGRFKQAICLDGNNLIIGEQKISLSFESDPKKIKWAEMGTKYVVDCTGKFTTVETATAHLRDGVEKVFISAPSKDAPMFVVGVNLDKYKVGTKVLSCASCTTNCLAPLAKIVHNKFQIDEGLMTTVHAATASQRIIDSAATNKSWRSSRSGMANIIPLATGAAEALGKVIPELNGKVTGMAFRVPISTVSVVDFTCRLGKPAKLDEIKALVQEAANGEMKDIITYVDDEVVSSDFIGSKFATAFDARASIGLSDNFVKLIAWYDNESGYAAQLARLVKHCITVDLQAEEERKEKERKEYEKQLKEEEERAQKEAQQIAEQELKAKVLAECCAKIAKEEKEKKEREECKHNEKKKIENYSKTEESKKHPCEDFRCDENKLTECCANLKLQNKEKIEKEACAQKERDKKELAIKKEKLEKCITEMEKSEREKLEKAKKEKEQKLKDENEKPCTQADVQQLAESSNSILEKVKKACAEREQKEKQLAKCCAELAKKEKEEKQNEKNKKAKKSEKQQNEKKSRSKLEESCPEQEKENEKLAQLCEERNKTNKEVIKLYTEIEKKLEKCSSDEKKTKPKDPCTKKGDDSKDE